MDGDGFYDSSNGVSTGERTIDDDYVENFELGGKFTLLDNRLQINAAAYRINWDGLPVIVIFDTCGAITNAGTAESTGIEFQANYQVNDSLLATFSSSYVNAELTTTSSIGNDGDRMPGSPKYNYSIGLRYDFNLSGYDSFLRGDYFYVGGFYGNLQQAGAEIADYGKLNLRSGVFINNFNVNLYINNLTKEKALTWNDSELAGFNQRGYFLRPRTIGFNIGYKF